MSFFNFTRQEQITILFLVFAILVGGTVTLIRRHYTEFAPELGLEEQAEPTAHDTVLAPESTSQRASPDTRIIRKLDINKATEEELMELPGIGPKTARLIVAYRTERGEFQTLEELKGVKGIGDKTFEQVRPLLKIE